MAGLNEFLSNVRSEGLMFNSRFSVTLAPPLGMQNSGTYDLRKILLYCDSIPLPSMSMSTTQARTFGEYREMPYERLFANINMTFFVDNSMQVKDFFDQWMSNIIDPVKRTVGYYKDYITDMSIDVFDIQENKKFRVNMFECYPKEVSQIQLDYSNKDVMKLTVSMNYKYWISVPVETTDSAVPENATRTDLVNNGFVGDSITPPKGYFDNFSAFQTSYNSFENQRNSLFQQGDNIFSAGKLI